MSSDGNLFVQIGSYNTNLQGGAGVPQDLVDWLLPTIQVASFLSKEHRAPDIFAIGFQELLPLHLGLAGLSKTVLDNRDAHIRSQIEKHTPGKESYTLVAKAVNVGVALLVYARDSGVSRQVCDVQTQWTGTGPAYMGNKGAVGIRFRVSDRGSKVGEVFTFVCAHLTAHEAKLAQRVADYHHIVSTLLFPSLPSSPSSSPTTMYSTSHLFFLGDLNFRVTIPPSRLHEQTSQPYNVLAMLKDDASREQLKEFDQLLNQRRKGTAFIGLREGPFWAFKCTYKYKLGEVDRYSTKRTPSWTDRIMYATHTDSPDSPEKSNITNILYTSIPSYVTSDHKPVVCLLRLPPPTATTSLETCAPPMIQLPSSYTPTLDLHATLKRYTGRTLDRIIGSIWWLLTVVGAGSAVVGIFNFFLGLTAWRWWKVPAVSVADP
ncbi:inositol polyphosphate phosphatase [Suillus bovinus]|uniref:inositol polyphosphate phosphatase n=1 Tax=Suillus bovinus TaxID=48563 RepID=UPI001B875A6F|nr:inositol polyphosphate phosphatase [Suillus bovinus]KAG2158265.1 inositol polyphosphate phosphatase [Suillus bovinus]